MLNHSQTVLKLAGGCEKLHKCRAVQRTVSNKNKKTPPESPEGDPDEVETASYRPSLQGSVGTVFCQRVATLSHLREMVL